MEKCTSAETTDYPIIEKGDTVKNTCLGNYYIATLIEDYSFMILVNLENGNVFSYQSTFGATSAKNWVKVECCFKEAKDEVVWDGCLKEKSDGK